MLLEFQPPLELAIQFTLNEKGLSTRLTYMKSCSKTVQNEPLMLGVKPLLMKS